MSKPSVLFLHGAGGGGWEWNIWKRVFQAHGYECHAPDFLPVISGLENTRLEDYSLQVQHHLLSMPSPKVIIGASLGGLLALMNAEHADAMVLINPMPPAPLHLQMPQKEQYSPIIPWRTKASLQATRHALFDSDEMTCLFAFRHWRDESGALLNAAMAGIKIDLRPRPVLMMASELDTEVPFSVSEAMAISLNTPFSFLLKTSHVGPLLGRSAAQAALQAVADLNGIFR